MATAGVELSAAIGVVFQMNLGPNTAALGASMAQYIPDASWKVVEAAAPEWLTVQSPRNSRPFSQTATGRAARPAKPTA